MARRATAALVLLALGAPVLAAAPPVCKATAYLTFDTGSQSQAELIATTLNRHAIKATFFLANEKTVRGDWSLDPSWSGYWKARVAEGHAIGTHTFDHVYWQKDLAHGAMLEKPQFGANGGKQIVMDAAAFCAELRRVDTRFVELTGHHIDPIWRAPGGHTSPNTLAAAKACGYAHVGWAKAGFTGDETASERFSNATLLHNMLENVKDGDIVMGHMGIWSRKDPWMPANLEPLIEGLQRRGFCFATLREHPDYQLKRTP